MLSSELFVGTVREANINVQANAAGLRLSLIKLDWAYIECLYE